MVLKCFFNVLGSTNHDEEEHYNIVSPGGLAKPTTVDCYNSRTQMVLEMFLECAWFGQTR